MNDIKRIVFTDLDGTLLDNESRLSSENRAVLESLGAEGVLRVVVTGRSLYSCRRVMDTEFPVDFLVFSTGAGIVDWRSGAIIYKKNIDIEETRLCATLLLEEGINFMLHQVIPDSQFFFYHHANGTPHDFSMRLQIYPGLSQPFDPIIHNDIAATQFLSILHPEQFMEIYDKFSRAFENLSIIKTTSPINGESLWLEIYAENVNKGSGAKALLDILQIGEYEAMAIGNDYNDHDLLEFFPDSYVVANAPQTLKNKHFIVSSNDRNGFSEAVKHWQNNTTIFSKPLRALR
jgi:Cof subfamily protein (haloacid dehalogenase superfamily)